MLKAEYTGPADEGFFIPGQVYEIKPLEGNEIRISTKGRRFAVVVEYPNIYEFFKDWKLC